MWWQLSYVESPYRPQRPTSSLVQAGPNASQFWFVFGGWPTPSKEASSSMYPILSIEGDWLWNVARLMQVEKIHRHQLKHCSPIDVSTAKSHWVGGCSSRDPIVGSRRCSSKRARIDRIRWSHLDRSQAERSSDGRPDRWIPNARFDLPGVTELRGGVARPIQGPWM